MGAKVPSPLTVLKSKTFARFARRSRIGDDELWLAAQRANEGLMDADLGGGVVKQRTARSGEGKVGGSRLIVLLERGDRAVLCMALKRRIGQHWAG